LILVGYLRALLKTPEPSFELMPDQPDQRLAEDPKAS